MKEFLKKIIYSNKILKRLYFSILVLVGRGYCYKNTSPVLFEGWGMLSVNKPSWLDSQNISSIKFLAVNKKISELVEGNYFNLSQFDRKAVLVELKQLQWRHYIVYSSILLAGGSREHKDFVAVELGVCDGLTAAYAINAMNDYVGKGAKIYLIDAWQAMRESELMLEERGATGAYSYLSLQNTKNNLNNFTFDSTYIKGYVPEILNDREIPLYLDWLHIDLNASQPTIASLDFFWHKMRSGGIVLLDDYGFIGYQETRKAVDLWVNKNDALLIAIPTGQAIIFKN